MQKIVLSISKCIPGMITAQPITDLKTGNTIIGQNQVLTAEFLHNLPNFIYDEIWIYLDSFNKVWNLSEETISNYKKYSKALNNVIGNLSNTETLQLDDFKALCEALSHDFKGNYNLLGCTQLIQQLDHTTYTHSLNVAFLSALICRWCNLGEHLEKLSLQAGLLHDVGISKMEFTASANELTLDEYIEYEKHPIDGYHLLQPIKELDNEIKKAVLAHHERCDCSGFPLRLSSPYISKLSKIIGLADAYDHLHAKYHIFETLRVLLEERLTQFDLDLLFTFCHTIANYYIGVFVTLNTGEIGEVVFINPTCIYKPIVKINDRFINIYHSPDISIISIE